MEDPDDDSEGCLSKMITAMKDDNETLGLTASFGKRRKDEGEEGMGVESASSEPVGDEKQKKKAKKRLALSSTQTNPARAKKLGRMAAIMRGDNY